MRTKTDHNHARTWKGSSLVRIRCLCCQPHLIIALAQSCSSMCIWLWKDSHGILHINRRITNRQNEPAEAWKCTCVNNSDNRNLNESLLKFSLISAMFISNYCCYSCFLWDCIWSKSALWLQTSTVAFFSIYRQRALMRSGWLEKPAEKHLDLWMQISTCIITRQFRPVVHSFGALNWTVHLFGLNGEINAGMLHSCRGAVWKVLLSETASFSPSGQLQKRPLRRVWSQTGPALLCSQSVQSNKEGKQRELFSHLYQNMSAWKDSVKASSWLLNDNFS